MVRFSVIIPLYNGEKYIEKALNCVLNQTFKDYEIVVCNDGSKDNSEKKVKDFQMKHPQVRIKYIYQQNKGLGGARNTAMRNAEGEIFALLDQDDIWYENKLEVVNKVFIENDVDIVCNEEDVIENGKKISVLQYDVDTKNIFRRLLFKGNCLSTSATSFKREIFEKIGPFSEDVKNLHFVEDYDYWLRIAAQGFKFFFIKQSLGQYILHESNYSSNNQEMMCKHTIYVIKKNYSEYKDKKLFDWFLISLRLSGVYLFYSWWFFLHEKYGLFLKYFIFGFLQNPLMLFIFIMKKIFSNFLKKSIY